MNDPEFTDRFLELLIQRSTTGLTETELQEFDQLALKRELLDEADRFDMTAAAFEQALQPSELEVMPRDLQDRLLISAGNFFGGKSGTDATTDTSVELADRSRIDEIPSVSRSASRFRWRELVALGAVAACLLILVSGFNPFAKSPNIVAQNTPAQNLALLTSSSPADLIDLAWTPVHDTDASGKVVWSDSRQEGYMVFENLNVNDPMLEKYQLWIFDTDKKQERPIDGGVFDIGAAEFQAGKVVVPIKPNLRIAKAVQFAVTVEKPPGVVVSKRDKIPVIATLD